MKATKIFFNGEQFDICDNLQDMIQNSLDSRAPDKCLVKKITVGDNYVQIPIIRIPNKYYESIEGFISLGDAMILLVPLTGDSKAWITLGKHNHSRNLMKYLVPISEIVNGYNTIMRRNNKLLDMEIIDYYDEITFTLIFKK